MSESVADFRNTMRGDNGYDSITGTTDYYGPYTAIQIVTDAVIATLVAKNSTTSVWVGGTIKAGTVIPGLTTHIKLTSGSACGIKATANQSIQ